MERAPGTRGSNALISVNEARFHPLWTMIIKLGVIVHSDTGSLALPWLVLASQP